MTTIPVTTKRLPGEDNRVVDRYQTGGISMPSVTQIIYAANLTAGYKGVDAEVLANAGRRGDRVHVAASRYLLDEKNPGRELESVDSPFWKAIQGFGAAYRIKRVVEVERVVYCPPLYAGTLDALLVIETNRGETPVFLDWKTRAVCPADGIQVSAYQHAYLLEENTDWARSGERWVVQLAKNGTFKVTKFKEPLDFQIFMAACNIFHWRRRQGLV